MAEEYQRIIYPERAEYLNEESIFRGYKVFLDHWNEITSYLQESFEVLRTRRFSKGLIIYGKQGCGKSIFANKVIGDYKGTKSEISNAELKYSKDNIWHRITAGTNEKAQITNITAATSNTVIVEVENKTSWIEDAERIVSGNTDRACLVIADNCERDYFLKGLLNVSDEAYLQTGRSETALRAAAHKFVELSRTSLRGCFFIFFTNDEEFALAFDSHVNEQHNGLIEIRDLKMPNDIQKETIVRINVNRLNKFSYWLCIDRAGPDEKVSVWNTLKGAETFPASFKSVDNAIRSSPKNREGRPARKCILNLVVFTNTNNIKSIFPKEADIGNYEDIYEDWDCSIRIYKDEWAELISQNREFKMLSSEWSLKIIVFSDYIVGGLLEKDILIKELIDKVTIYHAPGTRFVTRDTYSEELKSLLETIRKTHPVPNTTKFWSKGIVRNHDYENALKQFYETYNTKGEGFLSARPDVVINDFEPCSVLKSSTGDITEINEVIRRLSSVIEFTAINDYSFKKAITYLREQKIDNYVATVQEQ